MKKLLPILVFVILLFCLPTAQAGAVSLRVTVVNTAPTLDSVLSPDDDPATPGVQVPHPSTNKTVTIIASVSDDNGWDDVVNVTAEITGPSVVEDSAVHLSLDSTVNIATAIYKCSFNMSNHREGDYKVVVTATDADGLKGTSSTNFSYRGTTVYVSKFTDWGRNNRFIVWLAKQMRIIHDKDIG